MRAMHRFRVPLVCLSAALAALVIGCAEMEGPYSEATLAPQDFGLAQVTCPPSGYVLLDAAQTTGRFPSAIAVACLGHLSEDKPGQSTADVDTQPGQAAGQLHDWRVRTLKAEQGTYWNTLFESVPQAREVIVLARRSMPVASADLGTIAGLARRDRAGLCFVYGPATTTSAEAAWGGVLLDTLTGKPVAYIRAEAGPADFEPCAEDRSKHDRRNTDSAYLAERKLRAQLRACVVELMAHDTPAAAQDPNPWQALSTQPSRPQVIVVPAQAY